MSLDLGSAWSSPRRSKLLVLTVLGLCLLLLVPLYQLTDHDASGIYSHLTKYLGHDGDSKTSPADNTSSITTSTISAIPEITSAINNDVSSNNDEDDKLANGEVNENEDEKEHVPEDNDNKSDLENIPAGVEDEENKSETAVEHKTEEIQPVQTSQSDQSEEDKPKETSTIDKPEEDKPEEEKKPKDNEEQSDNQDNKKPKENEKQSDNQDDKKPEEEHKEEPQKPTIDFRPEDTPNNADVYPESRTNACDGFPQLDNITLVMKTGATEAFEKLPTQLLTSLQCIKDFLLFSDLEQNVGNYHVYDVLADVTPDAKQGLMEFDLYDTQANCPVSQKDCTGEMSGGWELDKYKFMHMIERTWKMRPNRKWYVFAEADSYVFWPNLIYWLNNKVIPEKHKYVGSVALLKNMPFAHGGSGYVISGDTVEMMATTPNLAHKYDLMAPHECCGDYLMALAVNDTGSLVKQAHPMFNGEKPNTLPYGHGHWCEPLLTMHHMNSEEVSSAWYYEQTRKKRGIVQIKEMYEAFMAPKLVPRRDDYDNLSDDVCYVGPEEESQNSAGDHEKSRQKPENEKNPTERGAHIGPDHCAAVCMSQGLDINQEQYDSLDDDSERYAFLRTKWEERSKDADFNRDRQCFQWRYHNKACCIARSFKLGKPRVEERPEDKWTSGWFMEGIDKWIEAKGDCQPEWKNID